MSRIHGDEYAHLSYTSEYECDSDHYLCGAR